MKLSFTLLLSISCLLLGGCIDYDPPYFYETVSINLANADNSGEAPALAGDSVSKNAYAIQLDLTLEPRYHEGADSYESEFRNEDQVTDFSITCSDSFNGIVPGQLLNHLFNQYGKFHQSEITPTMYASIFSGISPGVNVPSSWNSTNYLLLMVPPITSGTYTFHVLGTFSDGRILSDSITVKLY